MKRAIAALLTIVASSSSALRAQTPTPALRYEPYLFKTVAGLSPGSVDGGGANPRFQYPVGIAVDAGGNAYVADTNNHTIRKITAAGEVTTFAGAAGPPGYVEGFRTSARFTYPQGVALDASGNLYVTDAGNRAVRKIDTNGIVTTFAGGTTKSDAAQPFLSLAGITTDPAGNVYVADSVDETIRKITPAGEVSTIAGTSGSPGYQDDSTGGGGGMFNGPTGLVYDPAADGALFVADSFNGLVRIVGHGVTQTLRAGGADASFNEPRAVAVDAARNLYVVDRVGNRILVSNLAAQSPVTVYAGSNDAVAGSADGNGTSAQFFLPEGLCLSPAGELYVADSRNATVRKIDAARNVTTVAGLASAGSADGAAESARFRWPMGVAVDHEKNIYVADSFNSTVRKITPAGVVSTLAGTPGVEGYADTNGSAAQFREPTGVAVDSSGNVYVADRGNDAIRKITPAGQVSTFAQIQSFVNPMNPQTVYGGPEGVALDSSGNVYVAATAAHAIYKIDASGHAVVFAGQPGTRGGQNGTGTAARFNQPGGLTVDDSGNVYVADSGNRVIRKITPDGVVSFASPAITRPRGVAVDAAGNLYVSSSTSALLRKVAPDGTMTLVGGAPGEVRSADGISSAARFGESAGIAIDPAGKLYLADMENNVIRTGTPAAVAANIATRIQVGTQGDVLIGGFIVTGTQPKKVMVRGIGPSLKSGEQELPGRLLDPVLELHAQDGTVVAKNDDWPSDQAKEIADSGLAPSDTRESAIIATIQPGLYTAIVAGAKDATGIGVVDVYDLDATAPSQIAQISTRGKVLTGDNVMIGGFILTGSGSRSVLVRAIGPELKTQGVDGALDDPTLAVYNANGDVVRSNDNWRTDQEQAIKDTGAAPTDDREAAIVEDLAAGAYTAVVSGKDNSTGVAIVEVYTLQ